MQVAAAKDKKAPSTGLRRVLAHVEGTHMCYRQATHAGLVIAAAAIPKCYSLTYL